MKRRGALVFKGSSTLSRENIKRRPLLDKDEFKPHSLPNENEKGDGRIVCSGVTVQGMETRFKEQISVGDIIQITHPQTLTREQRIVSGILSQRSLTLESPFSSDFVSTIEYTIRKGRNGSGTSEEMLLKKEESSFLNPSARSSEGTLEEAEKVLTYREKVGMSYKTVSVKVDKNMSKEDLLDLQTKRSHDRYC